MTEAERIELIVKEIWREIHLWNAGESSYGRVTRFITKTLKAEQKRKP